MEVKLFNRTIEVKKIGEILLTFSIKEFIRIK